MLRRGAWPNNCSPRKQLIDFKISYYQIDWTAYWEMSLSGVSMAKLWIIAWQTNIRSKGSLCNWGSRARCNVAPSSSGRVCMPCFSLCAGMSLPGGSGSGRRPRTCLMEISQAETELRKTSFAGSLKSSRAWFESSGAFVIIQRNAHVSKRILILLRHKKMQWFPAVVVQRTQAGCGAYPSQGLLDV